MDRIRRFISHWLGFSRKETNGFLVLIPAMIILIFSVPAYRWWLSNQKPDFSHDAKQLDSLVALWNKPGASFDSVRSSTSSRDSLFIFNPNKVSVLELQRLGFSKHLSMRIANYRSKGGVFRVKADLMKIYGVDSTFYNQLFAYISLPEQIALREKSEQTTKPFKSNATRKFDINSADTTQLKTIYGIGSKLALRIIKFRDALGGFITQDQYREVYGLDSTVVNRLIQSSFITDNFQPQQIDMNKADEQMLSSHPYIRKTIAKALVSYRFQHGNFIHAEDIRKLVILKTAEADKLLPYLKVN
jgi:DNA uptake protein ComE-like DNA-binding protein